MKNTVDVFVGSPIEIESERLFLDELSSDLIKRGQSAIIFANFFNTCKPIQIDFFVVTSKCACHIELKNWTAPVFGNRNGPWSIAQADGTTKLLGKKNPYRQTIECKYAISDEMQKITNKDKTIPKNWMMIFPEKFRMKYLQV